MEFINRPISDRALGYVIIGIAATLPVSVILMFWFDSAWWLLIALPFLLLFGG